MNSDLGISSESSSIFEFTHKPVFLRLKLPTVSHSLLLITVLCILSGTMSIASVPSTASYTAASTSVAPTIVNSLNDSIWSSSVKASAFISLQTRRVAADETNVGLFANADAIFVRFECKQTETIAASQSTNNVGFGLDDYVGLGIDTSNNGSRVYYFEATPRGTRYQQSSEYSRYLPNWVATGTVVPGEWSMLMKIPRSVLRERGGVQNWRFNFIRHVAISNNDSTWAFNGLMQDDNFGSFSDSRFWPTLANVKPKATKPSPVGEAYVLGSTGEQRHVFEGPNQTFASEGSRFVGGDLRYPITDSLAFVGTLAPDFSNAETDQITVAPQEFRLALTEYRPFFAQGARFFSPSTVQGIYGQSNSIFYTQSLGVFDRGEKIEGTVGKASIGLLDVRGDGFEDEVLGIKQSDNDRSFNYWFDLASAHHGETSDTFSSSGAASDTAIDTGVYGNKNGFLYSLDYGIERGSLITDQAQAFKSEDKIGILRPNYAVTLFYEDVGPQWNPLDGFTNVSDVRGPAVFGDVHGSSKGFVTKYDLFAFADRFLDRSGHAKEVDTNEGGSVLFSNGLRVSGGAGFSSLRFYENGNSLGGYPNYINGVDEPFAANNVAFHYGEGGPTSYAVNYQFGPFETSDGVGMHPTYLQILSSSGTRSIGNHYYLSGEYDHTLERRLDGGELGQSLSRVSVGDAIDKTSNVSVSLRTIFGEGGFANPGQNLSLSFRRRFPNDSEVFFNYGAPDATSTLQRFLLKYLYRFGSQGTAGT